MTMECSTWQNEFQIWLSNALDAEAREDVPAVLAEHAAECAACARRLEAGRLLIAGDEQPSPPARLADRIMERVHERAAEHDRGRFGAGPNAPRRRSRVFHMTIGAAALLAVVFSTGVFVGRATGSRSAGQIVEAGPETQVIRVEFRLVAPDARRVAVVGDWNGWEAGADPLDDADGDGVWEGAVELRRAGEYEYQFLIDDERWIPDPESPLTVDDGYGGRNSILNI